MVSGGCWRTNLASQKNDLKRKRMVYSCCLSYRNFEDLPGTRTEDEAKYLFYKVFQVVHKKVWIQPEYQHFTSDSELSAVGVAREQL